MFKKKTKLVQLTDGLVKFIVFMNSPFQGCLRAKAKVNFVTKETRDLARFVYQIITQRGTLNPRLVVSHLIVQMQNGPFKVLYNHIGS